MPATFENPPSVPVSRLPAEPRPHSSQTSYTLTPELMAEAAWRLGWLGLIYAGGGLVGHFGRRALLAWTDAADSGFLPSDIAALISIAMGVAIFFLSRSELVSPKRLVDFG